MTKIDAFVALLGIGSYLAIMLDMHKQEARIAKFEAIQEKQRLYAQIMAERHKAELARLNAEAKNKNKSASASLGLDDNVDLASMLDKVSALQKLEQSASKKPR